MRAKREFTAKLLQQRLIQAFKRGSQENLLGVSQNTGGTVYRNIYKVLIGLLTLKFEMKDGAGGGITVCKGILNYSKF